MRSGKLLLVLLFAALFAGCENLLTFEPTPKEKVGVLANLDITWPKSTGALRRALAHFKAEKVSKVIIVGDPTKNGYKNQQEVFQAAWNESFRGTKAPELVLSADPAEFRGIKFTGKGRFPLTDLLCVHPLTGKRINAGSMRGIEVSGIFDKPDQRTISRIVESAQGLLVSVFDDGMKVARLDFSGNSAVEVGPAWEVDNEGLIHAETARAPEFWADTRVSVVRGYDKVGNYVYTVRWPPVLAKYTGARAFSYDVSVGKKVIRRVQSRGFFLDEARDAESVSCIITQAEIGDAEPKFGVTPISSLGYRGKTVWTN